MTSEAEKLRARRLARDAIKKGLLARPEACSRCGDAPKRKDGRSGVQGHHHDYSKPLDVEWLCSKCHRAETPLPAVMGAPSLGSKNGQARLTEADVILARQLRSEGWIYRRIAERFGVDKMAALRAVKGQQWAHVKEGL